MLELALATQLPSGAQPAALCVDLRLPRGPSAKEFLALNLSSPPPRAGRVCPGATAPAYCLRFVLLEAGWRQAAAAASERDLWPAAKWRPAAAGTELCRFVHFQWCQGLVARSRLAIGLCWALRFPLQSAPCRVPRWCGGLRFSTWW